MDLRQLRLFLAVAEAGHFTRAAERVNLSQPALTHNIRQLEEGLGVTLFERTPRGARLTPAGEALLPDARHLLTYAEESERRARRAGGHADDLLRVAFDFTEFGSVAVMPSLLGAFRERFPDAAVEVLTLPGADVERAVAGDGADFGFMLGPPERPELEFHPLLTGEFKLLLPAAHPLAAQAWVPPAALHGVRLLLPRLSERQDAALLSKLGSDLRVIYRGGDVAALRGLVAAGEGALLLPSALIVEGSAGLTARSLAGGAPTWTFGLVWRTHNPSPLATLAQRVIRQRVPRAVEL